MEKQWDPNQQDLLNIKRLLNSHKIEYDKLIEEKRTKEYELSKIKNQIRTGGYMQDSEYKALCRNQDVIVDELASMQTPINNLKKKMREKDLMIGEIKNYIDDDLSISEDLKNKVVKLRDYYTEFSSDATRVSSTRIMASKFVEQIQELLNIINESRNE